MVGRRILVHLEALVVNGHLTADAELNLERVHADKVPGVEERLVLVSGSHEPIVRILRKTPGGKRSCVNKGRPGETEVVLATGTATAKAWTAHM